jgi:acylphosphatase
MKKHLLIFGKVQGVGFRYWLYEKAIKKNIRGYVKNRISGEVEALLIGNDEDVNELIKQCEKGPYSSNVTQVKIQDYKQEYSTKSFDILNSN